MDKRKPTVMPNALAEQHFEPILSDFLDSRGYQDLGIGKIESVHFRSSFERPFSLQAIYTLHGTKGNKGIFVKVLKNAYEKPTKDFEESIEDSYKLNSFWHEKINGLEEYRTFKPVYCSIPQHVIITEELLGSHLGDLVRSRLCYWPPEKRILQFETYMEKAGRFLRLAQGFACDREPIDLGAFVEDIDIRLKLLVSHSRSGFSAKDRQGVLGFFAKNLSQAQKEPMESGLMHGDFSIANFLVNERHLIPHDFSTMATGPTFFDLTRFFHHLELLRYRLIFLPRVVTRLQDSFLAGYGYQKDREYILFRFYLLRHTFTHFLSVVRHPGATPLERLYNLRVAAKHRAAVGRLIR